MPPWLIMWIARFASGERFRKATPRELRLGSAMFAFAPIFIFIFGYLGHSFLDRLSAVGIWFYIMGSLLVAGLCLSGWVKLVPAVVSWIIAAIAWITALCLAFAGRL